jgi:hypothetical protein
MKEILVSARVGKYFGPSVVPNDVVCSEQCVVFAAANPNAFAALLNSSIGQTWVWQQSSRHETRLRFSPSDALETLPFPNELEPLEPLGEEYLKARREVMRTDRIGLTKLYNRFHTDTERDPRIERLRALQREMDAAVARAYGWDDLEHGFHEVPYLPENDRVRFTISEGARVEVLRRLSELNRQRYEEEVARGLYGDAEPRASTRAPRARRITNAATVQPSLDLDAIPAYEGQHLKVAELHADYRAGPYHAVAEYLKARPGWHAKADVLVATGITDGQWNAAITDLISRGRVERQGERRGTRYRLIE